MTKEHDDVLVFIHGTVSCALQSLKDLCPSTPPLPTYRFEHDTFHRVKRNGEELAELISTRIKAKRLLLVGHSRGGLVGRVGLSELTKRRYPAQVDLVTVGTPHKGTPLANVAKGLVNLLLKVGSHVSNGIPLMSPVVAGFSLVYDISSLPDGIAIMQEGSEALDFLSDAAMPRPEVRCWGSNFDIDKGASGFGIDIESVLMGAMAGIDHDLVVPTQSALGYGQPQPVLSCSHDRYFTQSEVQHAVFTALSSGPRPTVDDKAALYTLAKDLPIKPPVQVIRKPVPPILPVPE